MDTPDLDHGLGIWKMGSKTQKSSKNLRKQTIIFSDHRALFVRWLFSLKIWMFMILQLMGEFTDEHFNSFHCIFQENYMIMLPKHIFITKDLHLIIKQSVGWGEKKVWGPNFKNIYIKLFRSELKCTKGKNWK